MMPNGGARPGAGRPKGVPNKMTALVRDTFQRVFAVMQYDENNKLEAWAKRNPDDFYKIAAKLIPLDVAVQGNLTLQVISGIDRLAQEQEDDDNDLLDVTPRPDDLAGGDLSDLC